jgi:hypothetical protein
MVALWSVNVVLRAPVMADDNTPWRVVKYYSMVGQVVRNFKFPQGETIAQP